jgi:beta-glucosidase
MSVVALSIACLQGAGAWPHLFSSREDEDIKSPLPPTYKDISLPFEQRVDDLISRMTLEEKASQLVNASRPIPRLGIPGYNWWNEALHGVARNGVATVFPQAIALGATFDPALIHDMAEAVGTEGRIKYNLAGYDKDHVQYQGLSFWSPNINIFRDPRWGRGQETYGEDPFLTAQLGKAFITGLQGDDPKFLRAIATPKHYAVHSGPETTRHSADVLVSKHDIMDTYLPQFRAAVVEAKAQSTMCAYNRINGQPACAQDVFLDEILRKDWDFKGVVVSDCDAIQDIATGHKYAKTVAEAAALSLKHGVDSDCSSYSPVVEGRWDYQRYVDAVQQGLVQERVVDQSLKRLFLARMKLGMFDPIETVPFANVADKELDSEAHRAIALRTARESIVLLKNKGALPLKPAVKRIAVVGPLADQVAPMLGNYNGTPSRAVSALEGLKRQFPNAEIVFEPGTNFLRAPADQRPDAQARAVAAAKGADAVVAVVGITPELEGEEMKVDVPGFMGGDRTSLDLPAAEENLLKAICAATKKPLVVVLYNGSALAVNWAAKKADAIVEAWYGGEEAGTAIADVVSGNYNPSGRLPVTFYKSVKDLPPFDDYAMSAGLGRTYRYFKGKPLFHFGYGLSYTAFSYRGLKLSTPILNAGDDLGVDVTVTNTGKRAGDEVVQLYLSFPGSPGMPLKALRGVQRISLGAGASRGVHFALNPRDLSSVTQSGEVAVQPGTYTLALGGGQPGATKATTSIRFTITGEKALAY